MTKRTLKIIAYVLLIAFFLLGIYFVAIHLDIRSLSPSDIKDIINGFGIWAPIVFILMFTLVPLTLFPDAVLAIAAGLTFGLTKGTAYTMLGAISGATLSFYLSRCLGKDFIQTLIRREMAIPGFKTAKNNFLIILLLRLIPLFPFDIISYGAGLSKIGYREFILATFVGIIPGVVVYVNLGDKSADLFSVEFVGSLLLLALIFISSFYLKKRFSSQLEKSI